ncbi:DUF2790 domain-containing protein [Aquipseudomonas alcaligenes]|uniref:DUF2790 domain-containing protein n=1 Tax=Aquipseudomonas alcaligenes TaxID=43263 RepID=UPI0037483461
MKAFIVLALASLSSFAFAATTAEGPAQRSEVEQYQYGMDLDVARVISTTDTSNVCGVTRSTMVYEDHQGERHSLSYLALGGGCRDN